MTRPDTRCLTGKSVARLTDLQNIALPDYSSNENILSLMPVTKMNADVRWLIFYHPFVHRTFRVMDINKPARH